MKIKEELKRVSRQIDWHFTINFIILVLIGTLVVSESKKGVYEFQGFNPYELIYECEKKLPRDIYCAIETKMKTTKERKHNAFEYRRAAKSKS